ncbi:hypothetical protein IKE72_02670 [Candidatus Saccharibacteria bacterium]|nr:hypothetical protein [Candidatus Saccharibacteria bacterium]
MKNYRIITLDEESIRRILAKKYGVNYRDVHLRHEDYEISGFSGHAIPAVRYSAKIVINGSEE